MFKVATIQFKPEIGNVEKNRNSIYEFCHKAAQAGAKAISLPEMSLTGYIWLGKKELLPFAEKSKGESYQIFAEFCKKYQIYLSYGFAEYDNGNLYNSQNLISPKGELLLNYRKVHLFEVDTYWATAGDQGFKFVDTELGRIGLGICMDLNFDDFVDFHRSNKTDWLFFATNWLEQNIDVHAYWKERWGNFKGTAFMANTYGFEYSIEFCGQSTVYEKGDFSLIAAKSGSQILISEHKLTN